MVESEFIDQSNKKWLWSYLDNEEEVGEVCKYLVDNNLKIELKGNGAGGWNGSGINIMLEGVDLSGNGFCFNGNNLLLHVRYFRKIKEISQTEDFKSWLQKYPKFNIVKRYFIEKDQRWIDLDKMKSALS